VITTHKILKAIGCSILNLNLYKGKGYWYFIYDDLDRNIHASRSVHVMNLSDLSLDRWVEEGKALIEYASRVK
jgi:hypothetical protein